LLTLFGRPEIPVNVRSAIADELGTSGYLPAKNLLMQGLSNKDSSMRSACIRALGIEMEVREAASLLVAILLYDEYEHVKIDAAYGLGALRYKPGLPAQQVILEAEHDVTLRDAAYKAVLSILGKEDAEDQHVGKAIDIDWDFVHGL